MTVLQELRMQNSAYWSTYKKIEQEVIDLSYSITFNDEQINVYSSEILDIIIRICVNIESLYKDISRVEFGGLEKSIGKTASRVVEHFKLKDKVIRISHENLFFVYLLRKIQPFNYEVKSENDFYTRYCELKHDRLKISPKPP